MKSTEEIQGKIQLRPIRIIPVDFGYRIDLKKRNAICDTLKAAGFDFAEDIRLFGEDAILSVNCLPNLTMYLFADGVGVLSYEDDIVKYDNVYCSNSSKDWIKWIDEGIQFNVEKRNEFVLNNDWYSRCSELIDNFEHTDKCNSEFYNNISSE